MYCLCIAIGRPLTATPISNSPKTVDSPLWSYLDLYQRLGDCQDYKLMTVIAQPSAPIATRTRVALPRENLEPPPVWLKSWTSAQRLWLERVKAFQSTTLATLQLVLQQDHNVTAPATPAPNLNSTASDQIVSPVAAPSTLTVAPTGCGNVPDQVARNSTARDQLPSHLQSAPAPATMPTLLRVETSMELADLPVQSSEHVVASSVSQPASAPWTILRVATEILDPQTLHAFDGNLRQLPVMYKAHTTRRGYSTLASALRTSSGGRNLSRVDLPTRVAVQDSLGALSDLMSSYNTESAIDINSAELQRILATVQASNTTRDEICQLYAIVERDSLWVNALLADQTWPETISSAHLHELVGYFATKTALARPVTRSQGLHLFTTTQMATALASGGAQDELHLGLAAHKSAQSYGCLYMHLASWARNPWDIFLAEVRPVLGKRMRFATPTNAFPTTLDADILRYLTSRGCKQSIARLRTLVCRYDLS